MQQQEMATALDQHRVDDTLARPGALSYLEIAALDVWKSASFYREVVGWTIIDADSSTPKFMDPGKQLLGRFVKSRAIAPEAGLLPFIYVDRIERAIASVELHGGTVVESPYREGTLWIAKVRDPAGNLIGLWQDGTA